MNDDAKKKAKTECLVNYINNNRQQVGNLLVKSANQTMQDAAMMPEPEPLFREFWQTGEVCCLFASTGAGKSLLAVQIAEEIAKQQPVIFVDFELSDKQFETRYKNPDTGTVHVFPDNFLRAAINYNIDADEPDETNIINDIEDVAAEYGAKVLIVDNLTWLLSNAEKAQDAALFMKRLIALKKQQGLSLLIIAHTPKRSDFEQLTWKDLAGSSKLSAFFDSIFCIGKDVNESSGRYLKQIKVRNAAFTYHSENVLDARLLREPDGRTAFEFLGCSSERSHLQATEDKKRVEVLRMTHDGFTQRKIANMVGWSVGKVNKIINEKKTMNK